MGSGSVHLHEPTFFVAIGHADLLGDRRCTSCRWTADLPVVNMGASGVSVLNRTPFRADLRIDLGARRYAVRTDVRHPHSLTWLTQTGKNWVDDVDK